MIKLAQDVRKDDVIRPYICKNGRKRSSKEFTVTEDPQFATNAFSHYVLIPVINKKGVEDEIFIFSEEDVEVVDKIMLINKK